MDTLHKKKISAVNKVLDKTIQGNIPEGLQRFIKKKNLRALLWDIIQLYMNYEIERWKMGQMIGSIIGIYDGFNCYLHIESPIAKIIG